MAILDAEILAVRFLAACCGWTKFTSLSLRYSSSQFWFSRVVKFCGFIYFVRFFLPSYMWINIFREVVRLKLWCGSDSGSPHTSSSFSLLSVIMELLCDGSEGVEVLIRINDGWTAVSDDGISPCFTQSSSALFNSSTGDWRRRRRRIALSDVDDLLLPFPAASRHSNLLQSTPVRAGRFIV